MNLNESEIISGTLDTQKHVWLQVGQLITGTDPAPIADAHIVYNNQEIYFVGKTGETPPASLIAEDQKSPDLFLPDHILLPGLIEAHAHIFLEGGQLDFEDRKAYLQKDHDELLSLATKRLEPLIHLGIMGIRDAGDKNGIGLAVSKMYQKPDRPLMPYIDSPGAAIHHQGRYGSFMSEPIEDFETLEDCIKNRIELGAYRIKLIPTGIINFKQGKVTKEPQMTQHEINQLVSIARDFGKQTFAHASGDDGIEIVIEAGANSVEHGFFIRDDQLSRMRDRQIAWVPTFAPVQQQVDLKDIMGWDENITTNLQRILDNHAESLLKAHQLGVPIVAGSDAGSYAVAHGTGFIHELTLMAKAGMPEMAIVNAATGRSAEMFDYGDKIGKIEKGYRSRFILTKHSPLVAIENLLKARIIYFDGQVIEINENITYSGL